MADTARKEDWTQRRIDGWRDRTGRWVTGLTLYLLISGLAIYALPFSVFNQHAVLLHTLVGCFYVAPCAIYLTRHVRGYWKFPGTHIKFSGYAAALMTVACVASGLVLTVESALGTRITYLWSTVHVVTTFGLALFLGQHFVTLWLRSRTRARREEGAAVGQAAGSHVRFALSSTTGFLALTFFMAMTVRPVAMVNAFPEGYELTPYADASPFSPSLAMTKSGGAYDARTLAGSASCGTSGCHEEIYQEWLPSAHRYASMDVGFQAIQAVMAEQNGADSTRYCGGCHDPISLFSGTKNIGVDNLTALDGYQEGISCLACHSIEETDVAGNANYVVAQPERYVWEQREGPFAKFLSDFLIRAYPQHHVDTLSRRMFKTPEFCAACHKQFIDEEVNKVGWVQLQNQFDNWRASRWHNPDKPERTIECRECHMPLQASLDPAAGDAADANRGPDDGLHRSHRFLGANQYIPTLMDLEGADEHVRLTHAWLRGEIDIPEIEDKWTAGPAVPIELEIPERIREGEKMEVLVHLINNKVGHDFPTGPLDIIQAWVEIDVLDASGTTVFESGKRDDGNFIDDGTFMFKAEPVDRYGNLIDRHNLWEMVGVRFKRSLFPGSEEVASFSFVCSGNPDEAAEPVDPEDFDEKITVAVPKNLTGPLTVRAKLNYRKFDQYLLNFTFGEEAGLTSPITVMSEVEGTVELVPGEG